MKNKTPNGNKQNSCNNVYYSPLFETDIEHSNIT